MSRKYIHYGSDHFYPELFEPITNEYRWNKPKGGLWASPIDTEIGWYEWCIANDFHTDKLEKSFKFVLKDDARVLYLNDVIGFKEDNTMYLLDDSLKNALEIESSSFHGAFFADSLYPDFRCLKIYGYDAIYVDLDESILYWKLYGWDVTSLLVLNPDRIIEIDE